MNELRRDDIRFAPTFPIKPSCWDGEKLYVIYYIDELYNSLYNLKIRMDIISYLKNT